VSGCTDGVDTVHIWDNCLTGFHRDASYNLLHYPLFVPKEHVFALVSFLTKNLFKICSPVSLLKLLCICYPSPGHPLSGTVGVQDGGDGVQPC
jgi:hypothetical protein